MEIPGWTYIIIGGIIAVMSGIIYKTVPKNGQPNTAMAVFFFVGMIFILIGVAKIFFKRSDSTKPMILEKEQVRREEQQHVNRVEHHIRKLYEESAKQNTQQTTAQSKSSNAHQAHAVNPMNHQTHHQGISHTIGQANHPTHHAPSQAQYSQAPSQPQYKIISCPKCSTKNYSLLP